MSLDGYFSPGLFLYNEDAFLVMRQILEKHPDGRFDMIFSDPPYMLSNGGLTCKNGKAAKVDKGSWDKSGGFLSDVLFHESWLRLCYSLLKEDGTIWVCGTHHNIHITGYLMQKIGFYILNDIIWEKPNPPPNLSCRFFTHSTETLIWAKKGKKSKHTFNYREMKEQNNGRQMKSLWRILPPGFQEKIFGKHPTQKPLALLDRCIRASTQPGDLIFDPFMGSGTTGVSAINNGRRFCGCEQDSDFFQLALKRMSKND